MATPTVPNDFISGTVISSDQVDANFTALLNALTDGTADIVVGSIVVNGSADFAGNVDLGDTSGDTITINGTTSGGGGEPYISLASGTAMLFYQASAPTGWTKSTANNDKFLRVVSGSGGGSGGAWDDLNHNHTGPSHTHSMTHTHTGGSYAAAIMYDLTLGGTGTEGFAWQQVSASWTSTNAMNEGATTYSGADSQVGETYSTGVNIVGTSSGSSSSSTGSGGTGNTSTATLSHASGSHAYIDVIVCTLD